MSSREDLNKPKNAEVENLSELRRSPVPGIEATPDSVRFLGVELQKCEGGPKTPKLEYFERDVLTKMDLRLMQQIAACWSLEQIPCIEGGPGLGKTQAVQRMGAYLNQELIKISCHPAMTAVDLLGKVTTDPSTATGFGFVPGQVVQAMQQGAILFLDEYNVLTKDVQARLRELFDTLANGQRTFFLQEKDDKPGVEIKIHPAFRVVMAQNEPDGSSPIVQPLPEPDFSRVAYIKYPKKLPTEVEEARFLGQLGVMPELDLTENDYLRANPDFSREKLAEILGDLETKQAFVRMYQEFTSAVSTMVEKMEIARDQAQPITFNPQRDWNRVLDFVCKYYDGDLSRTTQKGLRFYFENRFEDPIDRAKVAELIDKFQLDTDKAAGRVELPPIDPILFVANNDREIARGDAGFGFHAHRDPPAIIDNDPADPDLDDDFDEDELFGGGAPAASPAAAIRKPPEVESLEEAIHEMKPLERIVFGRDPRELRDGSLFSESVMRANGYHTWVSRQHLAIEMQANGTLECRDLGSTFGTKIERGGTFIVVRSSPETLLPGDKLVVGHRENSVVTVTIPTLKHARMP